MMVRKAYEQYLATSGASQWLSWEGWQAAYAAGMERAAEICSFRVHKEGTVGRMVAVQDCADAIRAEIKEERS